MTVELIKFDVIDYLKDETDVADYLNDMLAEEGNEDDDIAAPLQHALGNAVRWGMRNYGAARFGAASGLSAGHLERAFCNGGKPSLRTVLAIISALGLRVQFVPGFVCYNEVHTPS
jgi:probable addiction module antidote protein